MKKPYIICHMMTSVDGRIDCAMTEHLPGVQEYYETLDELDAPSRVSGRVTAMLEMALPGEFTASADSKPFDKEGYSKAVDAKGYEIVTDTKGTLLWDDDSNSKRPLLIVTSENVSSEYLEYLESRHISWIACGKDKIDLVRVCDILADKFGVERMAVVGGGHVNAGFLKDGLLDEVSILIGAGIDGREGMAAVFDGLESDRPVTQLKLTDVKKYDSDAVWLRYTVK
ncbi:MAG: dihydrofolate reductase family protein [Ruminiclostridium sp.]|nr:dihydrofolate reductase family protein [Ruminiclostridium sp.]